MKIYVASAFEDFERTRRAQKLLREGGCTITCDWTTAADVNPAGDAGADAQTRLLAARDDLAGVAAADAVLLLTPDTKDKGCGCWVELGYALALGKLTVTTGKNNARSIFCDLGERCETDDEGIEYLIRIASNRVMRERRGREFG